jgi:hypothetical protein
LFCGFCDVAEEGTNTVQEPAKIIQRKIFIDVIKGAVAVIAANVD